MRRLAAYESTGAAGDVGSSNALRCSQPSQGDRKAPTLHRLHMHPGEGWVQEQ
ncbi:hypothetical protein [Candidatus Amarolinea aalborgensis]|uniref:hypothetical protein n=1 Tax=Candidatus Amarolinea aalborgensis TaxID=2249329 RepID=UPI003BF98794